ncbi:hypothetical protein ACFQRC_03010 [Enterovirga sp. GCM10030262]|uniref:hypothetical protein n=1 Tax=Enterovirga sp. GCM10030262 TaxID=3273391 RepID=UPI0036230B4E
MMLRSFRVLLVSLSILSAVPAGAQTSYSLDPDISWDVRCFLLASQLANDSDPQVKERARRIAPFFFGRLTARADSHADLVKRVLEASKDMAGKRIEPVEVNSCGAFVAGVTKHLAIETDRQKTGAE